MDIFITQNSAVTVAIHKSNKSKNIQFHTLEVFVYKDNLEGKFYRMVSFSEISDNIATFRHLTLLLDTYK